MSWTCFLHIGAYAPDAPVDPAAGDGQAEKDVGAGTDVRCRHVRENASTPGLQVHQVDLDGQELVVPGVLPDGDRRPLAVDGSRDRIVGARIANGEEGLH